MIKLMLAGVILVITLLAFNNGVKVTLNGQSYDFKIEPSIGK